ncbi:hypothetical protein ACQUQP_14325 [Marinobacterium sp. YM272]|uniref:hypothetical protein n=1 Tax=Marinobacterium sp. YM272 TaxID=3421654 RepID=UPI003D7F2449
MRLLILFLLFAAGTVHADERLLSKGSGYVVPEGKLWIIRNAPPADCRVCTADVYVKGELSNVELNGTIFHGNFDFSFRISEHAEVKLYPGTEIWLGDTRPELIVTEQER